MKIALTGASGHLGSALLQEINKRNIPVNILVRDENAPSIKNLPVQIVKGDLLNAVALKKLMQDCDVLVHSAAVISVNGDPKGLVHRTNVEGTKLVIETALQAGIKRCIHISSIHAYQQLPASEILDEQRAPVNETAFAYDRSKLAGQQIALEANGRDMEVIVLNPTSIIGPYDFKPSLMGQVIIDLYKGRLPFIFNGGFDFCDCRDVANAILNAVTMGRPGEKYLLSGKWYSLKQLVQLLSSASSKKINVVALPPIAAKAGLPFIKLLAAIQRKEPLYTNEALEAIFNGNRLISSAKAKKELNYTARPFEETMQDTFHWFKNKSYLV
ncbi:MAG: NAD-dependent epimerase/dehydratase family protein [Chitinophagaceae bacterium]|nr:NAD-dependent epimerase/dehydratase family protein [Chitinophagaceae bacterium]